VERVVSLCQLRQGVEKNIFATFYINGGVWFVGT
jgi:hypothetical protein